MNAALADLPDGAGQEAPFTIPLLVLTRDGKAAVLRGTEAPAGCARIRGGWRPAAARADEPAPA